MFTKTCKIMGSLLLLMAAAGAEAQQKSSSSQASLSLSEVEAKLAELRKEIDGRNARRPVEVAKAAKPATPVTSPKPKTPANKPAAKVSAQEEQQARVAALETQIFEQNALIGRLIALQQEALQQTKSEPVPAAPSSPAPPAAPDSAKLAMAAELESIAKANKNLEAKVAKLEAGTAASAKQSADKVKGLGNFSFSGDIRGRYEPFFGGTLTAQRNRARLRVRFNVNAKFNDEISGGFSLASGDAGDNISTNQTFTNFFQRKAIGIDKAFVQYNPRWFKPLTVTGGKWAAPWYRTEMTWDNDLNPEGLAETLAYDFKNSLFKKLVVVAFQTSALEVSNREDSTMLGGQVQTHWKFGNRVRFGAYAALYNWNNADPIRAAVATNILTGNSNTPAGTATQYASKFALLDLIGRFDVTTGWARWPLMVQFDFVSNTRACANLQAIPLASRPACNSRDRHGYWAEAQIGRSQEAGDWQFGYTFTRIEREAVLPAFNFSDLRQGSNVANHRINMGYQAYKNVTLGVTSFFGRALVTNSSLTVEPILKRFQFDVLYKF